jgi:hypothetical protein
MGSHVEIHMFLGTIKKKTSVKGYIDKNLLEPKLLKAYHDDLASEMNSRGYKHNTEITNEYFHECISLLPEDQRKAKIDYISSGEELFKRCPDCNENHIKYINDHYSLNEAAA